MPRLFYPPLVEPGVYIKPKGIQEKVVYHFVIHDFFYFCKPNAPSTKAWVSAMLLLSSLRMTRKPE